VAKDIVFQSSRFPETGIRDVSRELLVFIHKGLLHGIIRRRWLNDTAIEQKTLSSS
jgi:hypothetical protein